jgi:hypothetical protein
VKASGKISNKNQQINLIFYYVSRSFLQASLISEFRDCHGEGGETSCVKKEEEINFKVYK